ncbi:hypothetical protein GCM10011344_20400 [Dokdonia pacifica]|uniref:Uncharacterized protein n=1 Tax=Dokdonia pacifica TaxID=1627892 RepID=A0A238VN48_9FLAO|nr:hypothetical protein GCM10011344_20400 [Dokdonia pacifica]SNR35790.1 hypothetical protein SAMN06265376_10193 [Dokdonia pacifica]
MYVIYVVISLGWVIKSDLGEGFIYNKGYLKYILNSLYYFLNHMVYDSIMIFSIE